jgi:hypothetical protein
MVALEVGKVTDLQQREYILCVMLFFTAVSASSDRCCKVFFDSGSSQGQAQPWDGLLKEQHS